MLPSCQNYIYCLRKILQDLITDLSKNILQICIHKMAYRLFTEVERITERMGIKVSNIYARVMLAIIYSILCY